jgi:hypothetical protein
LIDDPPLNSSCRLPAITADRSDDAEGSLGKESNTESKRLADCGKTPLLILRLAILPPVSISGE